MKNPQGTGPVLPGTHAWKTHRDVSCFGGPTEDQGTSCPPYTMTMELIRQGVYGFASWDTAHNKHVPAIASGWPCGTLIVVRYRGKSCLCRRVDTGPRENTGRYLDLLQNVADYLGLDGTGDVEWDFANATDVLIGGVTVNLADHFRAYGLSHVGHPYSRGAVPDDDEDPTDRDLEDCSGLFYGAWRHVYKLVGKALPFGRMTAHDYWKLGFEIAGPKQVGDYFVKVKDGHAHHIGIYIGNGQTVDARGSAYGVHLESVGYWTSPEVHWMRLKTAIPLGALTTTAVPKMYDQVWTITPKGARMPWTLTVFSLANFCAVKSGNYSDGRIAWACEGRNDLAVKVANEIRRRGWTPRSRRVVKGTTSLATLVADIKAGRVR